MKRLMLGVLVFAAACSDETTEPLVPTPDGGVVVRDAGTRDAGTEDAGIRDAGTEDAGPIRTLVEHRLLGDSPRGNLVMNPNLTSLSTVGPFFESNASTTRHFADTPTKQPVAELGARDTAFLFVQSTPGLLTASIWLGRAGPLEGDEEVLIAGLARDELQAIVELTPVPGETRVIEERTWQRFEAVSSVPLVGSALLLVTNDASTPLFMTGPSLVAAQADVVRARRPAAVLRPAVRAAAESLLAKHREALLDRFAPMRPTAPRVP